MEITVTGLDPDELRRVLDRGTDHTGTPVTPFTDDEGDWPLRCCLTDSRPGERLAIIGFSPFPWTSAYATTGPVVVHAEGCAGHEGRFPEAFEGRDQVVRAFGAADGRTRTQVYDRNRLVRAGEGLRAALVEALSDDRVEFVQAYNVRAGCYSFTARRRA